MALYQDKQISHVIHRSLTATEFRTEIFNQNNAFIQQVPKYDEQGNQEQDANGDPVYEELPANIKDQDFTIRKLTLDVSENCYLIINDETWNPILVRTGGVTNFDFSDINISKLTLMKHPLNRNKDIIVYFMGGLSRVPKKL